MQSTTWVCFLLLAAGMSGCSGSGDGTDGGNSSSVSLGDNSFSPATLPVSSGASVSFSNNGQRDHTVNLVLGGDQKGDQVLKPGESTTFVFAASGSYQVYCRFHGSPTSGMAMTITAS